MYQNFLMIIAIASLSACCATSTANDNNEAVVCCNAFYHCVSCDKLPLDEESDDNGIANND